MATSVAFFDGNGGRQAIPLERLLKSGLQLEGARGPSIAKLRALDSRNGWHPFPTKDLIVEPGTQPNWLALERESTGFVYDPTYIIEVRPGSRLLKFPRNLVEALEMAKDGDIIELPNGIHCFEGEVEVDKCVTIRGPPVLARRQRTEEDAKKMQVIALMKKASKGQSYRFKPEEEDGKYEVTMNIPDRITEGEDRVAPVRCVLEWTFQDFDDHSYFGNCVCLSLSAASGTLENLRLRVKGERGIVPTVVDCRKPAAAPPPNATWTFRHLNVASVPIGTGFHIAEGRRVQMRYCKVQDCNWGIEVYRSEAEVDWCDVRDCRVGLVVRDVGAVANVRDCTVRAMRTTGVLVECGASGHFENNLIACCGDTAVDVGFRGSDRPPLRPVPPLPDPQLAAGDERFVAASRFSELDEVELTDFEARVPSSPVFKNNTIRDVGATGVCVHHGARPVFELNEIAECGDSGVLVYGGLTFATLQKDEVHHCNRYGIRVHGGGSASVTGAYVHHTWMEAISPYVKQAAPKKGERPPEPPSEIKVDGGLLQQSGNRKDSENIKDTGGGVRPAARPARRAPLERRRSTSGAWRSSPRTPTSRARRPRGPGGPLGPPPTAGRRARDRGAGEDREEEGGGGGREAGVVVPGRGAPAVGQEDEEGDDVDALVPPRRGGPRRRPPRAPQEEREAAAEGAGAAGHAGLQQGGGRRREDGRRVEEPRLQPVGRPLPRLAASRSSAALALAELLQFNFKERTRLQGNFKA